MAILKKGLSGEPVRRLQAKLGIEADGEFGPNTEKALKDWQTKNGLSADGIAGPDTFMAMGLYELVLLKQGTHGNAVKKLQEKLAISADGQFGSATEKAVRDYQQKNVMTCTRRGMLRSPPARSRELPPCSFPGCSSGGLPGWSRRKILPRRARRWTGKRCLSAVRVIQEHYSTRVR
jgi:peptidoglycan hydrolase-like protein with peptidoglycan-binding domain